MASRQEKALHSPGIARLVACAAAGAALVGCGVIGGTDANPDDSGLPWDGSPEAWADEADIDASTDSAAEAKPEAEAEASAILDSGMGPDSDSTIDFANCGRVTSLSDNIGETTVGGSIAVQGTASGPNLAALAFVWSASPPTAGTFSPPSGTGASPSSSFTCEAPGTVTITLTVSDGAIPDAAPSCKDVDTMSLVVVCDPEQG
jgi:hypothetical protein